MVLAVWVRALVMLVTKDVIDIPQSCDAIASTWETILKDNRSSFMIDPYGSPNHDALPPTT